MSKRLLFLFLIFFNSICFAIVPGSFQENTEKPSSTHTSLFKKIMTKISENKKQHKTFTAHKNVKLSQNDTQPENPPAESNVMNEPTVSPEEAVVHEPSEQQQIKSGKSRLWNLRNADIRSVIAEVSRETGKNFLLDPRVQGKISIIATTPMTPKEVFPVFLAALQISGYSAIPGDNITKIIPNIESNGLNNPLMDHKAKAGDEMVVQVIPVKFVSAQQLVPILRPLMPQWSQISAYNPSNMLILSGNASNLSRMAEIVENVDVTDNDDVNIIHLRNATAGDVVKTIKALQGTNQQAGGPTYTVATDDRSNSILISGNKAMRLRLRVLISELDTSATAGAGETQIIALHYFQAKDMLPILAGIAKSHYTGPVETIMGTRTITNLAALETGGSLSSTSGGSASPSAGSSFGQTSFGGGAGFPGAGAVQAKQHRRPQPRKPRMNEQLKLSQNQTRILLFLMHRQT